MKKKMLAVLLVLALCAAMAGAVSAAENIKIYVNGKEITSPVPPMIINQRLMVPLGVISQALGASATWDATTRSVNITLPQPAQTTPAQTVTSNPKLLTVNGEKTTWPYWYVNGSLYMEYKNAMDLLRMVYPAPWNTVAFYSSAKKYGINGTTWDAVVLQQDGYTTVSITEMARDGVIKIQWDESTGSLKITK